VGKETVFSVMLVHSPDTRTYLEKVFWNHPNRISRVEGNYVSLLMDMGNHIRLTSDKDGLKAIKDILKEHVKGSSLYKEHKERYKTVKFNYYLTFAVKEYQLALIQNDLELRNKWKGIEYYRDMLAKKDQKIINEFINADRSKFPKVAFKSEITLHPDYIFECATLKEVLKTIDTYEEEQVGFLKK
jgi:hypothetical protein